MTLCEMKIPEGEATHIQNVNFETEFGGPR